MNPHDTLLICPSCSSHIKADAAGCPFCGAVKRVRSPRRRLLQAAALFTLSQTAVACYGGGPTIDDFEDTRVTIEDVADTSSDVDAPQPDVVERPDMSNAGRCESWSDTLVYRYDSALRCLVSEVAGQEATLGELDPDTARCRVRPSDEALLLFSCDAEALTVGWSDCSDEQRIQAAYSPRCE